MCGRRLDELDGDDSATGPDEADGKVDLAEQQSERLRHCKHQNTALCWKRLTRLPGEMNTWFGLITSKTTMIATRPTTTGRTPLTISDAAA